MISNRSVPTDTVLPHLVYQDVVEAAAWLSKAFGFSEHYRYGEPADGAQMRLGNAWFMLRKAREDEGAPAKLGFATQSLTVFVEDVDGHFYRAKGAGAKIMEEPHETVYGEYQFAANDLDGHHWLFSRHARDCSPDAWGAKIAEGATALTTPVKVPIGELPLPRLCYLEIPAVDVHQSAAFYEKIFGWNIRHHDTERPSFDDATGYVSGAWVTGRQSSREPGLLPYIWVDDIEKTIARATAHGAAIVLTPQPDSPGSTSWFATFRDLAGNVMGLYQQGRA